MQPRSDRTDLAAKRAAERAADRDTRLAAYEPSDLVRQVYAQPLPLDRNDPAVRTYVASLTKLPPEQSEARLNLLASFREFVDERPQHMIDTIFDREGYQYVRRTYFEQQILAWSCATEGDWETRTANGDVIRDFFKANGHTIAPVVPSWHLWLRMG